MVPGLCPTIDFYLHLHTVLLLKIHLCTKKYVSVNDIERPVDGSRVNTRNVVYMEYTSQYQQSSSQYQILPKPFADPN
jgi:hypothetical protein